MKRCSNCIIWKSETEFAKKRDGKQSFCKICQSSYQRDWYKRNRAEHIKAAGIRNEKQIKLNQGRLSEYLSQHPCVDCGEKDILVLQFDHVREIKRYEVCRMLSSSWERILSEINKCEVRCANCHIRRTNRNSYRVLWAADASGSNGAF